MINPSEHYIEINDIERYTVPAIVSEKVNFILGSKKKIDYTSHLQTELIIINSCVKDILEINKNREIEHKLKSALQKFKQDYTDAYIELLNSLPSREEYYNHYIQNEKESNSLQNLCTIKKKFKKTCTKFKAQIRKENKAQMPK
ncbi:TPA: hypothetical protein SOL97_003312 [Clostridioides difficile]|nr:hypothetical protein [Clostridioides difficile]